MLFFVEVSEIHYFMKIMETLKFASYFDVENS